MGKRSPAFLVGVSDALRGFSTAAVDKIGSVPGGETEYRAGHKYGKAMGESAVTLSGRPARFGQ